MTERARRWTTASWLVAGGRPTGAGEPLTTPIVAASNFELPADRGYARNEGTPTWEALEAVVGGLDGGEAVAFASGMAAVHAVVDRLAVGARIVLPDDCYQGVAALVAAGEARGRWTSTRLPLVDTGAWIDACGDADLIWLESPSNPLLVVADTEAICAAPRKPGALLAVDDTFATPLNQRPLELGADVSVHSATKLIGGHSDLLCGIATAADPALAAELRTARALAGATPGALEAFLTTRGARTLAVRLDRAQATAAELADRLAAHPGVATVRYPGRVDHPTHDVARRVLDGFGTIVTFDLAGGGDAADALCRRVELVRHATSLGGVESTVERRSVIPGQEHLPPGLLRLSVGLEDVDDLWHDLEGALAG